MHTGAPATISATAPKNTPAQFWGRAYFAAQAVAGGAWWVAAFTFPLVRDATLGRLDLLIVAVVDIPLFVVSSALAAFGVRHAAAVSAAWTILVTVALAAYATVTTQAGWGVLAMIAAAGCSLVAFCLVSFGRVPSEWVASGPFSFRPARASAPRAAHVAATGAQIVVFWGLFLAVFPLVIAFVERRWGFAVEFGPEVTVVGIAVLTLASALGLWAAVSISTLGAGTPLPAAMTNRLVISGPYRFVRNPMAVAGITQGVAVGLIVSSWLVVGYAVAGSLVWNYVIRPLEEADLEERFGDEFRRYRARVRCWAPSLPAPRR